MSIYKSKTYIEDLKTAINMSLGIGQLKNSKILITGATGTIGSFLVDMLMQYNQDANANITVYAAGRKIEKLKTRFDSDKNDCLNYVEYDLCAPILFNYSVDYIIHAAGNAFPAAFAENPVETIVGNVQGTYHLLEYAKRNKAKRLLYISTGEVYGKSTGDVNEFKEEYSGYVNPVSPRSCYPNSKRVTETLCTSYTQQYGVDTVIVRPCHTYGPCMSETDNRANVQFIRNVLNDEDIILKSSGKQMRSYCYIADCASIIISVLVKGNSGEAYNSANSISRITIAGLAETIAEVGGKKVVYEIPTLDEVRAFTPIDRQVLNTAKIEALGWKGMFDISTGVEHTIQILKEMEDK